MTDVVQLATPLGAGPLDVSASARLAPHEGLGVGGNSGAIQVPQVAAMERGPGMATELQNRWLGSADAS